MIIVYSDGSHSPSPDMKQKPSITKGSVIIDGYGEYTRIGGPGWSDVAEYTGILLGLEKLIELKLNHKSIQWFGDNQFVINYLQRREKGNRRKDYYPLSIQCIELLKQFKDITFNWIPREQNKEADLLSKI